MISSIIQQIVDLLPSVIAIHFMNGAGVCWIIRRTLFKVYICLNHSWGYKHNQIERFDEKVNIKRHVFPNLDNFYILSVFRERRNCLTCSFC